jgi:hypothetical protein
VCLSGEGGKLAVLDAMCAETRLPSGTVLVEVVLELEIGRGKRFVAGGLVDGLVAAAGLVSVAEVEAVEWRSGDLSRAV